MCRFEVEYNFVNTKWGARPMNMQGFDTREEAEEFAKQYKDANVIEITAAWKYTTTGKKVRIW